MFKEIITEILGYEAYSTLEQGKAISNVFLHQDSVRKLQPYLEMEKTGGSMGKMVDGRIGCYYIDQKHQGEEYKIWKKGVQVMDEAKTFSEEDINNVSERIMGLFDKNCSYIRQRNIVGICIDPLKGLGKLALEQLEQKGFIRKTKDGYYEKI